MFVEFSAEAECELIPATAIALSTSRLENSTIPGAGNRRRNAERFLLSCFGR
jgi:hypothetical protein